MSESQKYINAMTRAFHGGIMAARLGLPSSMSRDVATHRTSWLMGYQAWCLEVRPATTTVGIAGEDIEQGDMVYRDGQVFRVLKDKQQ